MNSFTEAFSCNDKISKSDEESTWTMYLEVLVNCNREDYAVALENTDEGCTSLVSDAVTPAARKFGGVANIVGLCRPNNSSNVNGVGFKKRKKMNTLIDQDLVDTASSPVNSPKISNNKYNNIETHLKHKEKAHIPKEKGSISGQRR